MTELTLMHVRGDGAQAIGYGRLGVKLAAALAAAGVDIYTNMDAPAAARNHLTDQVDGGRVPHLAEKVDQPNHKKTNVVCWVSTPGHATGWWEGQKPCLFSMWEATRLPEAYREHLHYFDTLLVPSDHNLELFSQYHPNVKKVLLGVDTDQWQYVPRQQPATEFRFLCGGSGARKGTDLAFRAFLKAFPEGSWGDGPIPKMVFKNPKGEDFYHKRVEMVTGRLSPEAEIGLYASAHCYVQPSRGEGFGLQPLQAMAQGMPTILTSAHGHASFAHLGYGLDSTLVPASYFIFGDAGQWWEPDLDQLVDHMRYVYDHYDEAIQVGNHASEVVHRDFTWANCADQFIDAIGVDRLNSLYTGDGTWTAPERNLYLVRLREPWKADIAGEQYLFKPGETYYETADVKRILFEAGKLDPSCLELLQVGETSGMFDTGLTPEEVGRSGYYSAKHAYCPTCEQQLNTAVTRADVLEIEMRLADRGFSREEIEEVVYGHTLARSA